MEKPAVFQPLPHDTTGLPLAEAMLLLLLLLDSIIIVIMSHVFVKLIFGGLVGRGCLALP